MAGYAFSPIDFIPDFFPILGLADDLILIPLGIVAVIWLIPPEIMAEHRELATRLQDRPVSRGAILVIACAWATAIAIGGWLTYRYFAA